MQASAGNAWRGREERGSRGAIRLIVFLALHAGRRLCRALLVPISLYFLLTAPAQRRASLDFLARALGRRATWWDVFRHIMAFSTTLLDRVYLAHDRRDALSVRVTREDVFDAALASGRGCLLLGSHLGSFEMLAFAGSLDKGLKVNMVMHVDEAAKLQSLILGPGNAPPYRIIPLGQPGSMMEVRERLAQGEVVGILADRIYGSEATATLPFLGREARFSLSPFRLARITGAPVAMVYGIYHGGADYEIAFEALPAPCADDPRGQGCLAAYVESLERQARATPFNWFNFHDFWAP